MNTSLHTHQLKTWLQPHVAGLLAYAAQDADFAIELAAVIKARNWQSGEALMPTESSPYLIPGTQAEAVQLAQWVISLANTEPAVRRALATWTKHYEAPKNLAIGIIGIMIMGPTLGILEKKKKKKSQLSVTINQQWYISHTKKELVELVQNLSQKVIARELNQVGGNVYQLHPDSAAWCLGDGSTKLYIDTHNELPQMIHIATNEHLSHTIKTDEDKPIALALSPTINETFLESFAATEVTE